VKYIDAIESSQESNDCCCSRKIISLVVILTAHSLYNHHDSSDLKIELVTNT
jgi:hypothetical protein